MSHAAVVAREYGIPAVVGAAGATTSSPKAPACELTGQPEPSYCFKRSAARSRRSCSH
ncbi:MAG: PEP-utilizing enzyme [Actinomycetota bacterium]|nr:PEP-utilizing enzyme [Actinomycetota bacterium]